MTRLAKYLALGLLASGAAALFISTQLELDQFEAVWSQARYIYLLPCIVLLLAGLVTRAFRWQGLLNAGLPFKRAFSIINVAYLINGFIPFRIGELARIWLASRADPPIPYLQTGGTIIVERLLDLLAVVMMIALALVAGPVPEWLRLAGASSGIMAMGGFLVLVLLSRKRDLAHRLLDTSINTVPSLEKINLKGWLDQFLDGLLPLAQWRTLAFAFGWTTLSWGFSVLAGYILMFTFYEEASLSATLLYIAAAAFAIAVPAVPGNLGTYEAAIVVALSAVGYADDANIAAAFAVTVHAINVFVHASTGVVGFIQEGVSLNQLSSGVRHVTEANEIGTETV